MLLFDFQIFLSSHLIFLLRNIVQIQPCPQSMAWVYGIFNAIFRAGFPKLMLFTLTKTRKINARAHNGQTTDNKAEYPRWGEKTVNKKIDFSFRLATTTTNCKVMSSHWLFFFLLLFSWHPRTPKLTMARGVTGAPKLGGIRCGKMLI